MRDHVTLGTAIARPDAQASLPMSLPWLTFMDEKCSESYRPPVSCHAQQKTKNRPDCQSPSPSTMCPELAHFYPVRV